MGNRQTLPLLLVAALLAGGAFFWLDSGARRGEAPAREARSERHAGAEDLGTPTELLSAQAPTTPATAPDEGRRVATESTPAPVASPRERTSGVRVTGQVTDPAGAPLADVEVRATDHGGLIGFEVIGEVEGARSLETRTDQEGRFAFESVEPGVLYLSARRAGFAPFRREKIGIPREPEVRLEPCVMQPGAVLAGLVVDPSGRGVPDAEIFGQDAGGSFFLLGGRTPLARTDASGAFRIDQLAIGPWKFVVHAEDHPDRAFTGATARDAAVVEGLRWALEPGARISGRVTGIPEGERDALEVRAARAGRSFEEVNPDSFIGTTRVARVDPSGRFELRGVDVGGSYEIQARRRREQGRFDFFERSRSDSVAARAGDTGVLLSYQPEAALLLTVVDGSTGAPVEDLEVSAGMEWPVAVRDEDGRPRKRFPEGRVRAGGLRPDGPDQRVTLVLKATGYRDYRRDDIALRAGQELDLGMLRLEPVPVLRVQVLDAVDRSPVVGARVSIRQDASGSTSIRRTIEFGSDGLEDSVEFGEGRSGVTDGEGWAEITSMEGQTVALSARAKGYAPAEEVGILLPAGERVERRILMGRGGEALVRVVDASGEPMVGQRVGHREPGEPSIHGMMPSRNVTDSRGEVLFENLQAGLHAFRIDDGAGAPAFFSGEEQVVIAGMGGDGQDDWTDLQVAEGERAELRLVAAPRGTLAGRIREGGEPLAGATVELVDPDADPSHGLPMMGLGGGGPKGSSDASGLYRIPDVKAGRYLLSVKHSTRQMADEYPVEVREGDNAFDVDLPLSILEGRVTDEEGQPIAGVRVVPERAGPEGQPRQRFAMIVMDDGGGGGGVIHSGGGGPTSVRTDADGRYALRGVAHDVDLVVKAEGDTVQPGQSEPVRVAADEVRRNVDIALAAGGAIDVSAEASDGSPARMCFVQASYAGEGAAAVEPKFSFIQSGSTMLKGLKPGPWKLTVRKAGPGGQDDPPEEQVIEVAVGETAEANFRLE